MRLVGLVIVALVVIVGLSGCLGGGSDTMAVQDAGPYHWNETPQAPSMPTTYCRAKIVDKCKGLDKANDGFFLSDGRKVEVVPDCGSYSSSCAHMLYGKVTIGQEYIIGIQNGLVIRVYTLDEARDSCELREYINGKRCG